jgi:glycerol uptake facilitator-like aquaporin
MSRDLVREMLAEFLGTFVLIVFGVGVVAQTVLSKQSAARRSASISRGDSRSRWAVTCRAA